ncbi:putative FmdB family regulatory protein [Micromonospora sp. M71_S20]|uniref:FmdB family zinc ribbon protein n=1 Tax=Micromonospora sp. M71_S20 TaxID=592872 RepID=UPI000EB3D3E8|nr:FmdB family zinc ribbon protein [Micromonospora sp. M71_S20]RLK23687.1 putative FmdB family regulatory protein [Micromonospora sp. M71_S20]
MPTYQYACTACGHQLEAVQSFSDAPLTECPACEGRLRKVFNSVGIVFKGSGFYRTDSRSSGSESAKTGAAAKPAKSDSSSGGDSGSSGGSSAASPSSGSSSSSGSGGSTGGGGKAPAASTASAS